MFKIEKIIRTDKNEFIKYTHFFKDGIYTHSEKENVTNDEIGMRVEVARVPNNVEKWSYGLWYDVGTIREVYFLYEEESAEPIKKYLIHFGHGDMICEKYEEVYKG